MTEVYTLQPGMNRPRADWSPIAQPPDKNDIIAHTPNPAGYHDVGGGRTMIPRGTQWGGSQGFSTRPGVVNIDPADPVHGTGGITVDLEQVSKNAFAWAARESGGNPLQAWTLAARAQGPGPQPVQQPMMQAPVMSQPQPQPQQVGPYMGPMGYVVGHTNPSGGFIPMPDQGAPGWDPRSMLPVQGVGGSIYPQAPQMKVAANPSVKSKDPNMTTFPQTMTEPWGQPQQPSQATQPFAVQPPQQQPVYQGPQQPQYPQQPQQPPIQQWPQPQQAPQYVQPPSQPQQPDQFQMMTLQALQGIMGMLRDMRSTPDQPPEPQQSPTWQQEEEITQPIPEPPRPARGLRRQQMQRMEPPRPRSPLADYGLDFLYPQPDKPRIQVIFDLGPGGMHSKKFHHVSKRGTCLSLFYDTRYDGDQFIPAMTGEDETIGVEIPVLKIKVRCKVFDFHNTLGCIDILNFVVWGGESDAGPPVATDDTLDEIFTLAGMGG